MPTSQTDCTFKVARLQILFSHRYQLRNKSVLQANIVS